MTLRYKQTNERFACTEPISHRFDVAVDDDEPSIIRIPDITLATDRPVKQWVMGLGTVRLRLKLQKRASIPSWQKDGRVQPDGSLTMLGDHGSGSFWEPNSARDNIGRWQNLRVESRGEGEDEHLALVADAHVHTDLAANWLSRSGAFRPEAVASVFRSGTIRDTSIGFEFNHNTLKLEDEERQLYRTDDWMPHEASFVWEGADDTGIGRAAEDDMSKELFERLLVGQKTITDEQAALSARLTKIETPVAPPTPEPEPEPEVSDDQKRWDALVALAKKDGDESLVETIEVLELDPKRSEKLSEIIIKARAAKRPPGHFRSEGNGHTRAFDLMAHAPIALLSQNPVTAPLVAKRLKEVPQTLRTAPLGKHVEVFCRHAGLAQDHYVGRDPGDFLQIFKDNWTPPPQAVHSRTLGGHWLPGENAEYDHNGIFDVEATLRSSAGVAVPADFPALLVATQILSYDGSYNKSVINIDAWSRRKDQDTLDERPIVRSDVAVPAFGAVVQAGQDMPSAARWHDRKLFQVKPRGFLYSISELAALRDGGGFLVDNNVLLGRGWASEQSRYCVGQVTSHNYVGVFVRAQAIFDFLTHVFDTAFDQVPIVRPGTIDQKLPLGQGDGELLPTKLVYGPKLETAMSSFWKGRMNDGGRLQGDTSDQPALTDWMVEIGRSREMTPFVKDRSMYVFLAGGMFSSLIHGSLRGRAGVRITVVDDTNWKRWREIGTRYEHIFECQVYQENTLYKNVVP